MRKATELLKKRFSVFSFQFSVGRESFLSPFHAGFLRYFFLAAFFWSLLPGIVWGGGPAGKIPVAASIVPLGDFCRQLGGERVQVQVLIPPGASPHVFEPPPSVIVRAGRARLFVYIGGGLEPWMEKLLKSRDAAALEVVEAVRGLPLIKEAGEHREGGAEKSRQDHKPGAVAEKKHDHLGGHDHATGNPHVWLDPVLAQDICRRISAALIHLDPGHRRDYETRLQGYLQELEALHQETQKRVSSFRIREVVSFHPAFSYFTRRYGLQEAGVIELSPGREATPRHLQKIVAAIKQHGIRVVFAEPQLNPRLAQVVAREAGAQVLLLDPIGGRPPYGDNYLKLMRYNLGIMEKAMK